MFSGIIQNTALIRQTSESGTCRTVRIAKPPQWSLSKGQSVSVDGICSTVTANQKSFFEVQYMPETLSKTTAGSFATGRRVNLECSLSLRDLVDGHLVQGHIDTMGAVTNIETQGDSILLSIAFGSKLSKYLAPQGSITVNGISLTVAQKQHGFFKVALIPYTLRHTNLRELTVGSQVNIEVDSLARYVVAALESSGRVRFHAKKGATKRKPVS